MRVIYGQPNCKNYGSGPLVKQTDSPQTHINGLVNVAVRFTDIYYVYSHIYSTMLHKSLYFIKVKHSK